MTAGEPPVNVACGNYLQPIFQLAIGLSKCQILPASQNGRCTRRSLRLRGRLVMIGHTRNQRYQFEVRTE